MQQFVVVEIWTGLPHVASIAAFEDEQHIDRFFVFIEDFAQPTHGKVGMLIAHDMTGLEIIGDKVHVVQVCLDLHWLTMSTKVEEQAIMIIQLVCEV